MRQPSQRSTQRRQLIFRLDDNKAEQLLSRLKEQGLSLQRWAETQVDQLLSPAVQLSPAESDVVKVEEPTLPTSDPEPEPESPFREPDDEDPPDLDEDLQALIATFAEQGIDVSAANPPLRRA